MYKLTQIFNQKPKTISFELFPPKTDEGYQKLLETIAGLAKFSPDFISVTYGAGGGSRDKTFDMVQHIQQKHNVVGVAHLTCVMHTKDEIKKILADIQRRRIHNVLALRGDPPKDNPDWKPSAENFKYSSELCAFIRKNFGDYFGIGVAGFPEGHLLCRDRNRDAEFLKMKIDNGADFVITQLFFNNQDYFDYVKRLRKLGVTNRVLPGILPITDYQGLVRFCALCGAAVTDELKKIFEPIQNDKDATLQAGIDFCVRQCRELLAGGAPGIHFYTLNQSPATRVILTALKAARLA